MGKEVTLTPETFKALAGEKRIQILKELGKRRKTQSELAQALGISAPTVAEHVSLLEKAGLVHSIDDGHKWKYFALTEKGKELLNPGETRILVLLGTSALAFIAAGIWLFGRFFFSSAIPGNETTFTAPILKNRVADSAAPLLTQGAPAPAPVAEIGNTMIPAASPLPLDPVAQETTNCASTALCNAGTNTLLPGLQGFALSELTILVILAILLGLLVGYWWNGRKSGF